MGPPVSNLGPFCRVIGGEEGLKGSFAAVLNRGRNEIVQGSERGHNIGEWRELRSFRFDAMGTGRVFPRRFPLFHP